MVPRATPTTAARFARGHPRSNRGCPRPPGPTVGVAGIHPVFPGGDVHPVVWVLEGMPPEPGEWIIPAPLRTLLWWPLIAFVVAVLRPSAAAGIIAVAGAVLAVLGVLSVAVKGALPGRITTRGAAGGAVTPIRRTPAGDTVPLAARHGRTA
jgi:hypothetical protein